MAGPDDDGGDAQRAVDATSEALRSRFGRHGQGDPAARLRHQAAGPATRKVAAPRPLGQADYLAIKGVLHERLVGEIGDGGLLGTGDEGVARSVDEFVERVLASEPLPLNTAERARLKDELKEEALGVGPLAPLMSDPAVTDILVNGPGHVYVERFGRLTRTQVRFRDAEHLLRVIERIAARLGRRIDVASPMLDARLADGSRVNATIPPVSIDYPTLSIRRFGRTRIRRQDLVRMGSISSDMLAFLEVAVRCRQNILISGGTGAGKSTLLGAVAEAIPLDERVVTIEDPAELMLDQEHVVRMETRPANIENRGRVATRELVVNALRMRPDRIVVGEVRDDEALDMLQAMNTGHDGSLSTIHANAPRDALARLETMVLMSGVDLPSRAIREQIVSAVHLLVHVRRFEDGVRRVDSIVEITGLEGSTPLLQELFRFQRAGKKGAQVSGEFTAMGIVPRLVEEAKTRGVAVPLELFRKRTP